jgi:CDP-diacylglycerol--glycerol-3-phosphate 3-phosphatidyltransferase
MKGKKNSYYIINAITLYRSIAFPFLLYLVVSGREEWFKWLLPVSFFTDAIDGYLARKYRVTSIMGAKLDSIGDDLTVVAGVIGLFVFKFEFIKSEFIWLILIFILFLVQVISALARYGVLTSYHTYLAKLAAVCQGVFLILSFFTPEPSHVLYFIAISITALDLLEEIVLNFMLPEWKANVKGVFWVLMNRRNEL